jgi:hypothetical protein
MRVGDIITNGQGHSRTNIGLSIRSIRVLAMDKIKVDFADNLNMGIELEEDRQINRILIFDARAGAGLPVGMLFKNPVTNRYQYAERFPGVKLIERIEAVKDRFASMAHDEDLVAIARNLAKLFGSYS